MNTLVTKTIIISTFIILLVGALTYALHSPAGNVLRVLYVVSCGISIFMAIKSKCNPLSIMNPSKYKYIYLDNSKRTWNGKEWISEVTFECVAQDILEADKLYEQETGNKAMQQKNISCQIISLTSPT